MLVNGRGKIMKNVLIIILFNQLTFLAQASAMHDLNSTLSLANTLSTVSHMQPLVLDSKRNNNLVLVGTCIHAADEQAITRSYAVLDQAGQLVLEGGHSLVQTGFSPFFSYVNLAAQVARALDRANLIKQYRTLSIAPVSAGIVNQKDQTLMYQINFYNSNKVYGSIYTYIGLSDIKTQLRGSDQTITIKNGDQIAACLYDQSLTENKLASSDIYYNQDENFTLEPKHCISFESVENINPVLAQVENGMYQYSYQINLALKTESGGNYTKKINLIEKFNLSDEALARKKIINKMIQTKKSINSKRCLEHN